MQKTCLQAAKRLILVSKSIILYVLHCQVSTNCIVSAQSYIYCVHTAQYNAICQIATLSLSLQSSYIIIVHRYMPTKVHSYISHHAITYNINIYTKQYTKCCPWCMVHHCQHVALFYQPLVNKANSTIIQSYASTIYRFSISLCMQLCVLITVSWWFSLYILV